MRAALRARARMADPVRLILPGSDRIRKTALPRALTT
jgi:hypothetical protein